MIQHYLCKCTIEHQTKGVVSISHCDVWARGLNDAKEIAASDSRCAFPTHVAPADEMNRVITVEEEIIPGPDEVMFLPGYDSGDMECWCYDVTAWEFERVTGNPPEVDWDRESIIEGLSEPHWQLGMDAILKWAGGRPIRFEAKPVPVVEKKDVLTDITYTVDQMNRRCITSAYLVTGVLNDIEDRNVSVFESPGGIDFIDHICDLAQTLENWVETNNIEVEELSNGVFLYEEVEDLLAKKIVLHGETNDGVLPTRDEFIVMLNELRTLREKENE